MKTLFAALLLLPAGASAAPQLLAIGTLTGSSAGAGVDLSGQTGALENGVPGNALGGIGSGIAYAGNNVFLAVPDRGPNAVAYNAALDNTSSYISRFETIRMTLTPSASGLPFALTPTLTGTTLLSSPTPLVYGSGAGLGIGSGIGSGAPAANTPAANYFTGRSDNFGTGNSGNPNFARLDPEAIRVGAGGNTVFVSDEYGPYVYQFDRTTGARTRSFTLPPSFNIEKLYPVGATEISGNVSGRTTNKGLEGLAVTPDGSTLYAILQAATLQDAAVTATKSIVRIARIDVLTGAVTQYAYQLVDGSGVSEIVAINDHEFLVDERDGKGLGDGTAAKIKQAVKIDLLNATPITDSSTPAQIVAAAKSYPRTVVFNLVDLLGANGITATNVPAKIEGFAFGDDVTVGGVRLHTLWIANDNDFVPNGSGNNAAAGPNTFYVVGLSDADLLTTSFQAQAIPAPGGAGLVASALGLLGWLRRRA